jgi:hypothetical protein
MRGNAIPRQARHYFGVNDMPLRRESEYCHAEDQVGVTFIMIDDAGTNRVICRATFQALCDRAAQDGDRGNWKQAWNNHVLAIESLASANYDAGKPLVHGQLLVDTPELTPQR